MSLICAAHNECARAKVSERTAGARVCAPRKSNQAAKAKQMDKQELLSVFITDEHAQIRSIRGWLGSVSIFMSRTWCDRLIWILSHWNPGDWEAA